MTLKAYRREFRVRFTAEGHTETFVRSPVTEEAAKHVLYYKEKKIDWAAANQGEFTDHRPIKE